MQRAQANSAEIKTIDPGAPQALADMESGNNAGLVQYMRNRAYNLDMKNYRKRDIKAYLGPSNVGPVSQAAQDQNPLWTPAFSRMYGEEQYPTNPDDPQNEKITAVYNSGKGGLGPGGTTQGVTTDTPPGPGPNPGYEDLSYLLPSRDGLIDPTKVTHAGPVILHPDEMILPAGMSDSFNDMPLLPDLGPGPGGGTGVTNTIEINVTATESDLAQKVANQIQSVLYKMHLTTT
jgi:hypothetical protein